MTPFEQVRQAAILAGSATVARLNTGADDAPLLTTRLSYAQPDVGSGKDSERWQSSSAVCPQCQHRIVATRTLQGTLLVLDVTAATSTWRIRLDAHKEHYLAERGSSYQEHACPPPGRGQGQVPTARGGTR